MSLAIVIPYYKKIFFRETLKSIAAQTCKDFVLYIGDDASPENPQDIINEFKDKINIVYHRFDENIGGEDLVAQWERCINLTNEEEWLWLFSDDDEMADTCVEELYTLIKDSDNVQFVRFTKKFLNIKTGEYYFSSYDKGKNDIESFIRDALDLTENHLTLPEFAYTRRLYEKNGFVNFPLAWWADKATYLNFIIDAKLIYNLSSIVLFKFGENISSDNNVKIMKIKNVADIKFLVFMRSYISSLPTPIKKKYSNIWTDFINKMTFVMNKNNIIYRIQVVYNMLPYAKTKRDYKNFIKILLKLNICQ